MKHPARIATLAVAAVVIVFGVVLALNVGSDPQADAKQSHLVGKAAPSFDLPNLAGGRVTLADIAGKSAIVNFWNSWCGPCLEEAPALERFYADHKDDSDFVMVGIVRDDETKAVKAYVKDNGVGWTIALDPDSIAALDFGTRGQPETYAISPSGVVAAAKYGKMSSGELERFLDYRAVDGVIRRWGAWIALGVVVIVALAVVVWPNDSPTAAERARDLETELKCPECQGLSVADSQAPTSRAIRADVKRRIAAGQSDEEIRQAYIDKYGESILLSPHDSGVSLVVWILPIVVLTLGATGIVFALRRNRDEPHLHATEADERLVERERDEEDHVDG